MKTETLTINYQGLTVKADIEKGTSFPEALRELSQTLRQVEAGGVEEVKEVD